ncbi:MAG: universal stress protein [Caldilineaceae bacterium]
MSAHSLMRHGRVVDEVVAESRDEAYDLIVIGAFRATGLDRVVLSDQARAILAGTHEPLLVL